MNFYEDEPISLNLQDLNLLSDFSSSKQSIKLFSHKWLGKILVINGEIQHIENFQPFYHEYLVHLPISFIPEINTALIIGGGSLFAAYELLKYPTINKVVLCDYDKEVLALMERNYLHAQTVLNSPKFKYIEQDAHNFIINHKDRYDLVVNDCFNLSLESKRHSNSYYKLFSNLTNSYGVCSDIIYRHVFDKQTTIDSLKLLQKEKNYKCSLATVPEYPGIFHLHTIWGNSAYLSEQINKPFNKLQLEYLHSDSSILHFELYSPEFLQCYFHIPNYLKKLFDKI